MSSDQEYAVDIEGLYKSFKLPHERHSGIKQLLVSSNKRKKGYETQHVLKDMSFKIKKGEFFGIVGRNGSGKSTLLKLLAGIYTPDKGSVRINGSLTPFIELGVGFNPELTGRENIFLNGALLGFSHKEMEAMYDDIVDFSELRDFMSQKLKNYSSGMQVRLAFSIAIRADSDILLLDEVLAVGDEAFQRKCFSYFAELKKRKKTVILVTHAMGSVQQFCDRAMLVNKGEIAYIGSTSKVAQMYREENSPNNESVKRGKDGIVSNTKLAVEARLMNKPSDKELHFNIAITPKEDTANAVAAVSISSEVGEIVYRWASDEKLEADLSIKKDTQITISVKVQNIFPNGKFSLNLGLRNHDMTEYYISADELLEFEIVNTSSYPADSYWKPKELIEII